MTAFKPHLHKPDTHPQDNHLLLKDKVTHKDHHLNFQDKHNHLKDHHLNFQDKDKTLNFQDKDKDKGYHHLINHQISLNHNP